MSIMDHHTRGPGAKAGKPYKGMGMEGPIARWYTKIREHDADLAAVVRLVTDRLPAGSRVLEVAPGPGYLAIELAKRGYQVVGLDISASFVQIARGKASEAGVAVDFRHGNASDMPLESGAFDFIICCAAFKNFTEPVRALQEMHRVLRPGGTALINDLRRDASMADIVAHIKSMPLGRISRMMMKWTFKHMLLKRAYTGAEIRQFAAQTAFARLDIRDDSIGMQIWLEK